jgi:hypothetical protein
MAGGAGHPFRRYGVTVVTLKMTLLPRVTGGSGGLGWCR